ncbi:MAG TPA: CRISPR-associated ring nuclease, partial [Ktedonobacteraceae bacterium]|nr:CRISPR-associated ring nuclease [Ktedonobacteraceae bacterium]
NRRSSQEKCDNGDYDVFISYNHQDRRPVLEIGELLKDNGIAPFLDEWSLQPGLPWQPELEQQIRNCRAAVVFIGKIGIGGWQRMEIDALLRAFVRKRRPVIPALLADIPSEPEIPDFLDGNHRVDFRKKDPDPLFQLIWGITGKRPEKIYRPGVLIASLGDSPVVVSAMYDLLTAPRPEGEGLTLDRVEVLYPSDEEEGYGWVKSALTQKVELTAEDLGFKDADSWTHACRFLKKLYMRLEEHQKLGDSVYLSLAGGRKSMAALMAWVAPFFSCVKGLYHVLDDDEESFLTASQITKLSTDIRRQKMHPDLKQLKLVDLPFERGREINEQFNKFIRESSNKGFEEEEAWITGRAIVQPGKILSLRMMDQALAQFLELCRNQEHREVAQAVHADLLQMQLAADVAKYTIETYTLNVRMPKKRELQLCSFDSGRSSIRPVFYIERRTSSSDPNKQLEEVVVCTLERPDEDGNYRTLKQIAATLDFSVEAMRELPPVLSSAGSSSERVKSVLIVPLGRSPMVATQLFTLLKEQEVHDICEVVLIYPGKATEIDNGAKLLKRALAREYNDVRCKLVRLPGLEDIASREDCEKYQQGLEEEIARVKRDHPDKRIDLALSGGRKGMTAMTMHAARKNAIPYVYHTLVDDKKVGGEAFDGETSYKALDSTALSDEERHDRLFLRAYRAKGLNPYAYFTLFRVPVLFSANEAL